MAAPAVATSISSHYVASNLFLSSFVHAWVHGYFWLAELLLVINLFNLSLAYFRYPATPCSIHLGTIAGPLAWNFTALYWVSAVTFDSTHVMSRIAANASMWG